MYLYYFLAAVACWFGIQSLLNGLRFAAYVRRETGRSLPEFQPFASVIVPARVARISEGQIGIEYHDPQTVPPSRPNR